MTQKHNAGNLQEIQERSFFISGGVSVGHGGRIKAYGEFTGIWMPLSAAAPLYDKDWRGFTSTFCLMQAALYFWHNSQ